MPGLISVLGGKLTTYRLMAEKAVDLACRKLGVSAPCSTATTPI
jgi:glycerol-3-phosphate dehydrogenase